MDTELMDPEVTLDQHPASSSAIARSAEEFSGHDNAAAIGQILHASLDDHAKGPGAITDAAPLADGFASIVYFAAMAADGATDMANGNQREPRPTYHRRTAEGVAGAESVCSTRGHRAPNRPWRLPAVSRKPTN